MAKQVRVVVGFRLRDQASGIRSINTSAFLVTNLGLGVELWIEPYQNWVDDKPINVTSLNGAVGLFARTVLDESDAGATDSSKGDSDQVSNNSFDGTHKSHFKSTGPPGTDGDEGFRGPYSEMRHEGNGDQCPQGR